MIVLLIVGQPYQNVGNRLITVAPTGGATIEVAPSRATNVQVLADPAGVPHLLGIGSDGRLIFYNGDATGWAPEPVPVTYPSSNLVLLFETHDSGRMASPTSFTSCRHPATARRSPCDSPPATAAASGATSTAAAPGPAAPPCHMPPRWCSIREGGCTSLPYWGPPGGRRLATRSRRAADWQRAESDYRTAGGDSGRRR